MVLYEKENNEIVVKVIDIGDITDYNDNKIMHTKIYYNHENRNKKINNQ